MKPLEQFSSLFENAPTRLELFADWVAKKYPQDHNPEVQEDLRTWAAQIRLLKKYLENFPM